MVKIADPHILCVQDSLWSPFLKSFMRDAASVPRRLLLSPSHGHAMFRIVFIVIFDVVSRSPYTYPMIQYKNEYYVI